MAVAVVVLVGASRGVEAEIRNKIPKNKESYFSKCCMQGELRQSKQAMIITQFNSHCIRLDFFFL